MSCSLHDKLWPDVEVYYSERGEHVYMCTCILNQGIYVVNSGCVTVFVRHLAMLGNTAEVKQKGTHTRLKFS